MFESVMESRPQNPRPRLRPHHPRPRPDHSRPRLPLPRPRPIKSETKTETKTQDERFSGVFFLLFSCLYFHFGCCCWSCGLNI